jgi:hypothetical protein
MLVTCPESAHLEEIEVEDHPEGMEIIACTRFSPRTAVTCERLCAARLERRRRTTEEMICDVADDRSTAELVSIRVPFPLRTGT